MLFNGYRSIHILCLFVCNLDLTNLVVVSTLMVLLLSRVEVVV